MHRAEPVSGPHRLATSTWYCWLRLNSAQPYIDDVIVVLVVLVVIVVIVVIVVLLVVVLVFDASIHNVVYGNIRWK